MDKDKIEIVKNKKGFIAALDQSGGSSAKTLSNYGLPNDSYHSEEEMFDLIHEMRKRIIMSKSFTNEHILGVILFEKTMLSKINDKYTADYLWQEKNVVSFLKIDNGLAEEKNGVRMMKPILHLSQELREAKNKHIFGTKMRSVIYEPNKDGIKEIVAQQFSLARLISNKGFVPIIEPEVDINAIDKEKCENLLKKEIINQLEKWDKDNKIMFKFTLPAIPNFYLDLYDYDCILRIVALSGGYSLNESTTLLSKNKRIIASFSRALLEKLNINQSQDEFDKTLKEAINKIYDASCCKNI